MKLVQFFLPGKGRRVGVVRGDRVMDITAPEEAVRSTLDLVEQGKTAAGAVKRADWLARQLRRKAMDWPSLQRTPSRRAPHLLIPLDPPEVWGAGETSKRSAQYRDEDSGAAGGTGIYDYVYEHPRPELYFKATAARCVGPEAPVMVRGDSRLTVAEAELAVVLGSQGAIVGFTACNDMSAWDIERENPLFLPQSKVFAGCCAIGPVIVTAGALGDPYRLALTCRLWRAGRVLFEGTVKTSMLKRRCGELTRWLLRDNVIPPGTVVSTGTGILVPDQFALRNGDRVEISVPEIGTLANPILQGRRPS
jgi:2-dehydro-3-deoxy-D-arabinonate dehydratase